MKVTAQAAMNARDDLIVRLTKLLATLPADQIETVAEEVRHVMDLGYEAGFAHGRKPDYDQA